MRVDELLSYLSILSLMKWLDCLFLEHCSVYLSATNLVLSKPMPDGERTFTYVSDQCE
jgi:hypothetical protein